MDVDRTSISSSLESLNDLDVTYLQDGKLPRVDVKFCANELDYYHRQKHDRENAIRLMKESSWANVNQQTKN